MRDTPRTNALILKVGKAPLEWVEHARELERELAEEKAKVRRHKRYAQAVADAIDAQPPAALLTDEQIAAIGAAVPAGKRYTERRDRAIADAAAEMASLRAPSTRKA